MYANGNLKCLLTILVFLVVIECVTASGNNKASNPDPPDGAFLEATWAQLKWLPGDDAQDYDMYFGDNCAKVEVGAGATFRGRYKYEDEIPFVVGFPGYPYPEGLAWGTTYYWRVDEFDGSVTHRGDVWRFTVGSTQFDAARTLFVDIDATGANNGSSWTDAFNHLQDALAVAQYGTEIWVAEGNYRPDQGSGQTLDDRKATFQLKTGVSIYGGFKGDETLLQQRNWLTHETILSGDLNNDDEAGITNDNVYHVVTGSGTCTTAVLDGFTIMHGNATWPEDHDQRNWNGAGMLNEGGNPTVGNCRFIRNSAGEGGGMYNCEQSRPNVYNCTFLLNDADHGGGMLNQDSSNPDLTYCKFIENRAKHPNAFGGGGLYNLYRSSPKVVSCTFRDNRAPRGGGMTNFGGSDPDVKDCTFIGNWADYWGGGMYNDESSPKVFNCTFLQNSADHTGGAMYSKEQSNPKITNCTFVENRAVSEPSPISGSGGAIAIQSGSLEVVNCAFIQNSAQVAYGGAVDANDSDSVFVNCTFIGNSAGIGGAVRNGAYGYFGGNQHMTLANCILWDNTADTGPQIAVQGRADLSIDYCDLEGGQAGVHVDPECTIVWGTDIIAANPLLRDSDGRLSAGSPCIDAGDNSSVPAGNLIDLDGMGRFVDDPLTADTGAGTPPIVDMGAYEFDPSLPGNPFCSKQGSDEIFTADFESDQVGFPPAPTTPGHYGPAGASLETSGDIKVIDSTELGSKAIKITRSSSQAEIKAIVGDIGDAPYTTGVYYIDYNAHGLVIPEQTYGAMSISVRSTDNKAALSLLLYDGAYHLEQGGSSLRLTGSYDPNTAHRIHIVLDLDAKRYSICIDGEVLASNKPLLAGDFTDLHSLQFHVFPGIFEGFMSVNIVDDIQITK